MHRSSSLSFFSTRRLKAIAVFGVLLATMLAVAGYRAGAADAPTQSPDEVRQAAQKAQKAGNFKDAYESFAKLVADPKDDPMKVSSDLSNAILCLARLGRVDETDAFREQAVKDHAANWRLLEAAAQSYQNVEHQGFIVAGTFYRGGRRGNDGKPVHAFERDRIRALQLMQQASAAANEEKDKAQVAEFYFRYADMLLDRRYGDGAWRLQYLTDLAAALPDYEEGYPNYYYGGRNGRGAPVDEKGEPVYHQLPKSWEAAKTDGERWRWCLMQASEFSPAVANRARFVFASFLNEQFGVQTMAYGGFRGGFGRRGVGAGPVDDDDTKQDESGPFAVSTLKENETIARLANGIKRFTMPDEFNPIKLFQNLGENFGGAEGENSLGALAQIFEDRQQYDRAADYWKKSIDKFGPGPNNHKRDRVEQILGNWGLFDSTQTVPAGTEPKLSFLFRNGKKVSFTANEIDVKKLIDDVKAYIKTKPNQLDYQKSQVENVGYRLVQLNQNQYLGKQVAEWNLDLKPRDKHFDRRVFVPTPLKAGGAYLVRAKMEGGNETRIVLWVSDLALVKKTLDKGSYYFTADGATGEPVAKVGLDFFGYRQQWIDGTRKYNITTKEFADATDADGQLKLAAEHQSNEFQWLITATAPDGRMAYHGFTGVWGPPYEQFERDYNMNKVFTMTDRPVYRPAQVVKFKTWVGQTQYDKEGKSPFAGQPFTVRFSDPKGEKIKDQVFTADAYGGFDGEIPLPKDATLGTYSIQVINSIAIHQVGGGTFRVEEYKKPEFEVKVEAPTEPIMLGEKITATIKSNYYFGAPVSNAKVKYKVMRTDFRANWYPSGRWDWFYEPGYWWFGQDYPWYPGWAEWGCRRPTPFWFGQSFAQPEIVMENEVPVGPDGTVKVEIDTAAAKVAHADTDHKYEITAEVTDASRRTITGTGTVSAARKPFKVYAWLNRGYYQVGDPIEADFSAQTIDNKPIKGKGELKLIGVGYGPDLKPTEKVVQTWKIDTDDQGKARQQIKADKPGQYRVSYTVTDDKGHAIEGGYVFVVRGEGFNGKDFRFNDVEVVPDKKEYAAGDAVKLMVNVNRDAGTVLLFVRPTNGVYLPPKVIRMNGKSAVEEIAVAKKDMPNFYVEAVTVSGGKVFTETREIVVPPEDRVVNVEVLPSAQKYKPGEKAKVTVKLTDGQGKPVVGSAVVSVYDKSVEYISGGSNIPEIKAFFWKWRRHHYPQTESSLMRGSAAIGRNNEKSLNYLGRFGYMVADLPQANEELTGMELEQTAGDVGGVATLSAAAAPMPAGAARGMAFGGGGGGGAHFRQAGEKAAADGRADRDSFRKEQNGEAAKGEPAGEPAGPDVAPALRSKFADTAFWAASLESNANGLAEVELTMPENLTTWKTKVWTLSAGTRVGQGEADVVTYKNLIVRLQAPRFFVQKDEVVLSANVHNYLTSAKSVKVALEMPGEYLSAIGAGPGDKPAMVQVVHVPAGGEKRVDWRVKVVHPGQATVKMAAITDEESDAMQMSFPVYIHGMMKTESYSGALRPAEKSASLSVNVPKERIVADSRIEVRYSPSVASAMVDALPYLVDYPYGCTEQTLNRFVPTVVTQKVLLSMGLDLKDIETKRTNLNAQQIGDDANRAADWKRNNPPNPGVAVRNPVFDVDVVKDMSREGVNRLSNMQLTDGGWGWFSGTGEQSSAHTTAVVVHGLQIARENDVALPPNVLERGVEWLKRYQVEQVNLIQRAPAKVAPYKLKADNLDAFTFMVLQDANVADGGMKDMREFLYRDRVDLAVYCKAMFGLALHKQGNQAEKLDMILQNISQFLVKDGENQTAYLKLPENNYWWYWYGSDTEANAYYLKLLSKTEPKGETAPLLAKYLINNRKHASYWNSTRDTAVCIEALADYIKASGEDKPDMTVVVKLDGKPVKEVQINAGNFFSFDNKWVLAGEAVADGADKIEFEKSGEGPLYFNAYVTNFTLEDPIKKAGLEIKVGRKFYKLTPVDKKVKVAGSRGQALDQKVEKYERKELADLSTVVSGDLVEVELEIDSKNDYEYILFEDMKASGFEPVEVRSGYNGNDLNAYMELRDERVCFFARTLARGKHSVSYRLRAEIPGKFSALPTRASGMYAPELAANSDEFKVNIADAPEPKAKPEVPAAAANAK